MDLFAGCGGFAEGFRAFSAGAEREPSFTVVAAVEIDRAAAATFKANHEEASVECLDIAEFDGHLFAGRVDVMTGGPPCQGFSGLGAQRLGDPRNALWQEYVRVVCEVRPPVFVMENVDRFFRSPEYEELLEAVQPGGPLADYELTGGVLNAADYGVPQARRRAIVIGTHRALGSPITLPIPTHAKGSRPHRGPALLEPMPPLPSWIPVDGIFEQSAAFPIRGTDLPSKSGVDDVAGPFRTTDLHFGRTPTALSKARYQAILPRGNRRDLTGVTAIVGGGEVYLSTQSWDSHRSGSGDVMGRLRLGAPSVAIRTEFFKPEKGRYLHPSEHRPITHYEAALIQGFTADYRWYGTKMDIARQIGNAVPVGLARAVAGAIHKRLERA
ncbi:DNA cytosine methyltransferase [Streptomyces sp. NPDC048723]|uniref:DNA cytosine methyltransferase n=1 Tax=Streptomyces sp. NPDC048723 TaxID=3365589 RepID=UPI003719A374